MKGLFNKDILTIIFELKHRYNNKNCLKEYYKVFEKGYISKFNWRVLSYKYEYKSIYNLKVNGIKRMGSLPRKYQ